MAKLAGKWLKVLIDDSGGTPVDVSADVESIELPDEYEELDVTGFQEDDNSMPGVKITPVEIVGMMNPASNRLFAVMSAIEGTYSSHTLTVQQGQNAAPTTGDPEYEGEYWCKKVNLSTTPKGKATLNISLRVYGNNPGTWGTVA